MTTNDEWYLAMADAMRERSRALSMMDNWREKAEAAGQKIMELAAQARTETPDQPVTE